MTTTNDTTEHVFSPSELAINAFIEKLAALFDKYLFAPLLGVGAEAID